MADMKRQNAYEADQATGSRYVSTLVIAAAIIVAVRSVREDVGRPSPKLASVVHDSVSLARSILEAVLKRYGRG